MKQQQQQLHNAHAARQGTTVSGSSTTSTTFKWGLEDRRPAQPTGLDCIDLGQHQDAAALESDRLTMLAANVAVIVVIVVAAVAVAATAAAGCVILNNGASNCNSNSFRT